MFPATNLCPQSTQQGVISPLNKTVNLENGCGQTFFGTMSLPSIAFPLFLPKLKSFFQSQTNRAYILSVNRLLYL